MALDFSYLDGHPVHRQRAREIIARHPEVRRLMGANPTSALWVLGLVGAQGLAAYLVRDLSWLWILLAAYLFGAFITDMAFRVPAIELGEAQLASTPDVWEYVFSWASPAMGGMLGACHAIKLPFVFGIVTDPQLAGFIGDTAPETLAEAMQDAWLAFARTGEPSAPSLPEWPRYDTEHRRVMDFGEEPKIHHDPGAAEREFWEAVSLL